MKMDLSSFEKAIASLERALKVASASKNADADSREVIRAGVIQNFEFTYELCWKFMKRWLENNIGNAYIDGVSRRELFRLAAESRLIENVDQWMKYHSARNETAHTYDSGKADEIFAVAAVFEADAKKFLQTLTSRND